MNDDDYILMTKQQGDHAIQVLAFQTDGVSRAIIRCDTCHRHFPVAQLDPKLNFVDMEIQMHASGLVDKKHDGWHDGLGFTEPEDDGPLDLTPPD